MPSSPRRWHPEPGCHLFAQAGVSDPLLARARELHRQAIETEELAARQRAERDHLIRRLRQEDPTRWSYGAIANALGCSRELVALIVKRGASSQSR